MPRLIPVLTGCTCHFVGFVMLTLVPDLLPDLRIKSPGTGDIMIRLVAEFVEFSISDDSTR